MSVLGFARRLRRSSSPKRSARRSQRPGHSASWLINLWWDLVFTLAGAALCMFSAGPLVQAALAQQSTPAASGGGSAALVQALRARAQADADTATTARQTAARPDPLLPALDVRRTAARVAARSAWVRIPGDAPIGLPKQAPLASAASAKDASQRLKITVVLKRTDQAGFSKYLQNVYDRSSPLYDHYLTQAQLANRFGPSVSEYDQVKRWLVSEGFRVTQGASNRLSLSVRGTRAQAERAFDTPIRDIAARRAGVYANAQAPGVPRALAPDVQAVVGLSDRYEPIDRPEKMTVQQVGDYCEALFNQVAVNNPASWDDFFAVLVAVYDYLTIALVRAWAIPVAEAYCAGMMGGAVHLGPDSGKDHRSLGTSSFAAGFRHHRRSRPSRRTANRRQIQFRRECLGHEGLLVWPRARTHSPGRGPPSASDLRPGSEDRHGGIRHLPSI